MAHSDDLLCQTSDQVSQKPFSDDLVIYCIYPVTTRLSTLSDDLLCPICDQVSQNPLSD